MRSEISDYIIICIRPHLLLLLLCFFLELKQASRRSPFGARLLMLRACALIREFGSNCMRSSLGAAKWKTKINVLFKN